MRAETEKQRIPFVRTPAMDSFFDFPEPVTITFAKVDDVELKADVFIPKGAAGSLGALVYYHAGGLVMGGRKSWVPEWLKRESYPFSLDLTGSVV